MTKQTKISIIVIAILLVALAGIIAVNFIIHPVYSSYENENEEFRVEVDGTVYKYLPDTLWEIDSKPARRAGYLDDIKTTLHEYEGDSVRDAFYVSKFLSDMVCRPLVKEAIEFENVCAENVCMIKFDDPGINKYLKMILNSTFETTDEEVIKSFFNALRDSDTKVSEDKVVSEELSEAFMLKCYNKNLPIAAAAYQVFIFKNKFVCYDENAEAFSIIPAEVFSDIAGGGFDAGDLLANRKEK